ncbi:MAG: outer membrane beta-barrel protein [Chitinophagales bacterium]
MDEIFRSAYEQFGDDPSPGVWDKINAGLDKKDAASYKRISGNWKRIAILLLFILSGFIIYEAGIVKTNSHRTKENIPVTAKGKKTDVNVTKPDEAMIQNHFSSGSIDHKETKSVIIKTGNERESNSGMIVKENKNILTNSPYQAKKQTRIVNGKASKAEDGINRKVAVILPSGHDVKKELLKNNQYPVKDKIIIPSFEKIQTAQIGLTQLHYIPQIYLKIMNDSFSLSSAAKTGKQNLGNKFKPYWTVSGFTAYDWSNYRLDNDLQTAQKIQHRETHQPSLSGGVLVTKQLTNKFGLETGLIYSRTSIGISPQKIYALNDPSGSISYKYIASSGYGYVKPNFNAAPALGDSLTAAEANHTLDQVSVPLEITYTIRKNNLSFVPGIGIAASFLTSERIETEVEDGSHQERVLIDKLSGTRLYYLSFMAEAELQYNLSDKISINFRPAFRYAISPITKGNVVETYPYDFEAGLGLTYRF